MDYSGEVEDQNFYLYTGNSMKTSLIAFIIMIVVIFFAGNIPEQVSATEVNISGRHDNIVLAAPGDTPTPPLSQQLAPTIDQPMPTESDQATQTTSEQEPLANVDQETRSTSDQENRSTIGQAIRNTFEQAIRNTFDQAEPTSSEQSIRPRSNQSLWGTFNQSVPPSPTNHIIYLSSIAKAIPPTPEPPPPEPEINFTSDEGRSWSDYSGPSIWPDMQAYAPVGILSHPEDQINILLLGSDQRPNDGGFRTDTIQLLTINPSAGSVKLTSFPRDLYVNIPGYTVQRINTAFGWGGFDALADTMEYNFGVRPEYYVLINFDAFMDGINSLGGVVVDVKRDFCDHRDAFGQFAYHKAVIGWMARLPCVCT
jgi:LCP family protein required for cell wall assembly